MPQFRDDEGMMPLLGACDEQRNTELVQILLDAGAEASPPEVNGEVCHQSA